ncbi:3'-5' exoribonuclease YhaM [Phycisphaerae bacterium RAS1]|nr:3'-5' exoribonuclease YhaM [Phycisphaerae bacterium RAS1]
MTPAAAHRDIRELKAGDRLEDEIYRVAQKDLRTTNNGSLYIHVVMADATGQLLGRMWNASQEIYDAMPEGGLLHFRGRVENYKGARQFIVDGLRAVEPGEVQAADFLPATREDVEAMWARVKEILRTVQHRDLLALLARFVNDTDFARAFQTSPAAVSMHHARVGGLLEHTRNLLELALVVTPRYPGVSRDLVLAGIFLHDAGKVRELAYETNFSYTDEGQLIGHISIALLWIREKAAEVEKESGRPFPREVEMALGHIILAHHGKYEFGSPRLPATAEAIMVHYLDNLDAKLSMIFEAIEGDNDPKTRWTDYVKALETRVFKVDVMGVRSPPGDASRP